LKLGAIRKVDTNGRIQIPADIRETINIEENKTNLNVYVEMGRIIIEPFRQGELPFERPG
jgi:AbrB family looped-hinge helix DNA binding protein